MALVEAARFYNSFEAGLARSVLETNAIACVLFDAEMSWSGLGSLDCRLMVDEEDLTEARRLLSEGDRL